MPFLIDGHNLIGQMTDLSLEDEHDEVELVLRLRGYHARTRKKITVIFDHGLPGGPSQLSSSGVRVIFASNGTNADRLIARRIRKHKRPQMLTVVTSDSDLVQFAHRYNAKVVSSKAFANQLQHTKILPNAPASPDTDEDPVLSEEEVEEWLRLFQEGPPDR